MGDSQDDAGNGRIEIRKTTPFRQALLPRRKNLGILNFRQILLYSSEKLYDDAGNLKEEIRKMAAPGQEIEEFERNLKERVTRLRFLVHIRLIGLLWLLGVLPDRNLINACQELFNRVGKTARSDKESGVEGICQLFLTLGKQPDGYSWLVKHLYFNRLKELIENPQLKPQLRSMVSKVLDLQANKWVPKPELEEMKANTINGIHSSPGATANVRTGCKPMGLGRDEGSEAEEVVGEEEEGSESEESSSYEDYTEDEDCSVEDSDDDDQEITGQGKAVGMDTLPLEGDNWEESEDSGSSFEQVTLPDESEDEDCIFEQVALPLEGEDSKGINVVNAQPIQGMIKDSAVSPKFPPIITEKGIEGVTDPANHEEKVPQNSYLNLPPALSQGLTNSGFTPFILSPIPPSSTTPTSAAVSSSPPVPISLAPESPISCQSASQLPKVNVRGYMVSALDASVVEKIFEKHGDFMAGCSFKSSLFFSFAIDIVQKTTQKLLLHTAQSIPDLEEVGKLLEDLKENGVQVDWLMERLERARLLVKSNEAERKLETINKRMNELVAEMNAASAELKEARALLPEGVDPNEPLGAGLI